MNDQIICYMHINIKGIPVELVDEIEEMLIKQLHRIASGEEEIDLSRIKASIKQKILSGSLFNKIENTPFR